MRQLWQWIATFLVEIWVKGRVVRVCVGGVQLCVSRSDVFLASMPAADSGTARLLQNQHVVNGHDDFRRHYGTNGRLTDFFGLSFKVCVLMPQFGAVLGN
ncbi:unnamed protein product [Notodromas monacha]|uniref:Secreted protein n=1 Tax=Notodromas monacha TaxID=399045 RepID=A0A7R9BX07_9CRUS|nr:unnamed protein product [Notodromas monacha]CAG0922212.1 unnamed protein product [Notodromas monacha]